MSIITSTMLRIDPTTGIVTYIGTDLMVVPRPAPRPAPLGRTLAGLAAAGLATKLVEAAFSRRPR